MIPIDFTEEERSTLGMAPAQTAPASTSHSTQAAVSGGNAQDAQARDRALASQIPTDKEALFSYKLNWELIKKSDILTTIIAPWVSKKILEYLGEAEETLCSFILTKLSAQSTPSQLLGNTSHLLLCKLIKLI